MTRRFSILAVFFLICGSILSADVMVLRTGKKLRMTSYRVEGANVEVTINDRSEIVIPVDWVLEIRDEPDPPPLKVADVVNKTLPISLKGFVYANHVRSFSEKYDLDWRLITAVMKVESNFNPHAISPKGAQGLMQIMPDTSKMYRVKKPYDPEQNIEAGVRHLKRLMKRYDNQLDLVLAAYNAGEKAVDQFQGIAPFDETQQYVKKVLSLYRTAL